MQMSNTLLRKPYKQWTGTFTVTADGMLTFTNPDGTTASWLYVGDVDWERCTIGLDVTAAPTGTSPTLDLKLKTKAAKGGTAAGASTMDAKDTAGAAVAMTQATAAGRESKTFARLGNTASSANIGPYVGLYADVGGTTPSFTFNATLYFGK
jgi:hypothetical protein